MTSGFEVTLTDFDLTLPDGRTVSLAEYGDPAGRPVVFLHGAGSCRVEAEVFDAAARERGIRIIAPDRPGVGRSTELADRSALDYANDVGDIATALGVGRFAVSGVSNGGMYSFAVARALGDRVTRVLPINSATPVADPLVKAQLSARTRWSYALLGVMAGRLARGKVRARRGITGRLNPDRALLATAPARAWLAKLASVPRSETYLLAEIRLATRPWGFDHRSIAQPVDFLSGVHDAGRGYAELWVAELPDAALHLFPGGHVGFIGPEAVSTIIDRMAAG